MKNPITHFEIPADNIERAKKFYEKIFDWKIEKYDDKDEEYYFVMTTEVGDDEWTPKEPGAINGGLVKREMPDESFVNYVIVDSIDKTCKLIEKNGGKMVVQKTKMGEWGWWAVFKDTEGNVLGLYEEAK
jgi:predicted enzyme related to lactoylglutathione lyase